MTRRPRPLAALLAVFALVFAQLAVSAHVCEQHEFPARGEVTAHHIACHDMAPEDRDPGSGNVCFEHCQYGQASFDNTPPAPAAIDTGLPLPHTLPLCRGALQGRGGAAAAGRERAVGRLPPAQPVPMHEQAVA